jgi:hypothetical protein
MKRRAVALALGTFALVATMAMAQGAMANHETMQSTAAMTGSVVPAFKKCKTPNHEHAAPVAFPSCQTPGGATSNHSGGDMSVLLIGREFSGVTPGSTSTYNVHVINEGTTSVDVKVDANATKVYCENPAKFTGGAGSPLAISNCGDDNSNGVADKYNDPGVGRWTRGQFEGVVLGESTVRSTDHDNCNAPCENGTEAGTVEDFDFTFVIDCVGGTCTVDSSARGELAGSVVNGKRSVVQILSVRTQDPGADGVAGTGCPLQCGTLDEREAAQQGLFWR